MSCLCGQEPGRTVGQGSCLRGAQSQVQQVRPPLTGTNITTKALQLHKHRLGETTTSRGSHRNHSSDIWGGEGRADTSRLCGVLGTWRKGSPCTTFPMRNGMPLLQRFSPSPANSRPGPLPHAYDRRDAMETPAQDKFGKVSATRLGRACLSL